MSLPIELRLKVEDILTRKTGINTTIQNVASLSGGSINEAIRISANTGTFFLKWNDAKKYPDMFKAEAKGLQLLKHPGEIYIPEVIEEGEVTKSSFLLLEFISGGERRVDFFYHFGNALAKLHTHSNDKFGLDHDNYIGSLKQRNKQHDRWIDFFVEERLEKQLKLARDSGKINNSITQQFNKLYNRLEEIFPVEKPSLLHGDLWSGNYLTGGDGNACILDPAVYYGFREMDVAMSKLFGGFDKEFYEGYEAEWPMEKGWEKRIDVCNLYPLLVHVNLFDGGYLNDVQRIVSKF